MRRPCLLLLCMVLLAGGEAPAPLPVPAEADRAARAAALREVFKEDYARKRPEDRLRLVGKLLDLAKGTQDAVECYAVLREAIDAAARCADHERGLAAIDLLAAGWQVDGLEERLRFIAAAAPAAGPEQAAALCTAALVLGEAEADADRYPTAQKALAAAAGLAKAAGPDLAGRVKAAQERSKALGAEFAKLGELTDVLGQMDAAAHARYGRFLAFRKGDWVAAVEHLAAGDDAPLRDLAKAELAAGAGEPLVQAAEAWAAWAKAAAAALRPAAYGHAAELLRRAAPGLDGIVRARSEKRIEELERLAGGGQSRPRHPEGAILLLTIAPGPGGKPVFTDLGPNRIRIPAAEGVPLVRETHGWVAEFDGGNQLNLPDHPALRCTGAMTLSVWMRTRKVFDGRANYIFEHGKEWLVSVTGKGMATFSYGAEGKPEPRKLFVHFEGGAAPDAWNHIVARRDPDKNEVSGWLNGQPIATQKGIGAALPCPEPAIVGRGFAGSLAEIGLWPRLLSPAEVKALYEATRPGRR
jgi:hypothetical protein